MAIKNKKRYFLYLDEENAEYVKDFLETTRHKGGMSGLVDSYIASMAKTLRASKYVKGQDRVTAKQAFKIGIGGLKEVSE